MYVWLKSVCLFFGKVSKGIVISTVMKVKVVNYSDSIKQCQHVVPNSFFFYVKDSIQYVSVKHIFRVFTIQRYLHEFSRQTNIHLNLKHYIKCIYTHFSITIIKYNMMKSQNEIYKSCPHIKVCPQKKNAVLTIIFREMLIKT